MALAKLYGSAGHYPGVRRTLLPKMELGYSRDGAEFLFSQASVADDHPTVVEGAGDLRNFVEPGSTEDVWLVEQRAGALLASGDPEAALECLRTISEVWLIPQKRWV